MTELINAKRFELPIMRRASLIEAASINVDDRTFDIVWTTGARRITWSWDEGSWGGLVEEELDLAGADLSRLNNGAGFFKDHMTWSIDNQLGVHVDGSAIVDVEKKEGRAKIRFSKNAWAERYWNDIVDKILRQTSVGYQVGKYIVTREEGRLPLYRAVDWTPLENSQVGIAADPGAGQQRSGNGPAPKLYGCTVEYRSSVVISIPKEEQRDMNGKKKVSIPNQGKSRAMDDATKTKATDILKEYITDEAKLTEATDKIAALWPEETKEGAGEMSAVAKALGCKEGASVADIAKAATNLRTLCDSYEEQLEAAEGNQDDEFEANEKKGLHRNLSLVSPTFARELFDSSPELYREKVAKVKPLDSKPPAANAKERKTLASHEADSKDGQMVKEIEAEEKRLMELNPKLSARDAYTQAFETVKEKRARS
jgi:hypothetical protein